MENHSRCSSDRVVLAEYCLAVEKCLWNFIKHEALVGLSVTAEQFWSGFAALIAESAPTNAALLAKRDDLQGQIDDWHRKYGPIANNPAAGL